MMKLPSIHDFTPDCAGWGYFLCAQKDVRPGRNGEFVSILLQDTTGTISAKLFDDVERLKAEFDTGDFVKVQGRGNLYNGRLQFIVEKIRRVHAELDRASGFREEDCIPCAPRPVDEMWAEFQLVVLAVRDPHLRELLLRVSQQHESRLRLWPAARIIHHAYRGGFLEHILKIADVGRLLAEKYEANVDLVVAGAILHDLGKLEELEYDCAVSYSRDGNLVGHITLGVLMVREVVRGITGFPDDLRTHLEHLIVSHHGTREYGSPVEPMTVEAFILSMADDLDAKVNQIRRAIADDIGEGEFTGYQSRLGRVLWKGPTSDP